jgi:microcystin-dependent protein
MVFIATANQSVFTLSTPVINKPSALVTVDGVVQPTSEYSLNQAGTSLTLSEGVPVGTVVRVLALGVASAGAPADDSVTEPKLRDEAVTTPKLHPAVRVPVAAVFYLAASTAPAGFLIADGSTVPNGVGTVQGVTANFSALFAALGTFYGGAGKLPDLRGEFIRGWDGGRGVDPGRAFGSAQSDENKIHSHGVTDPGHNHALNYLVPVNTGDTDRGGSPSNFSLDSQPVQPSTGSATTGISIQASGGNEARPRNIALLPCIKY